MPATTAKKAAAAQAGASNEKNKKGDQTDTIVTQREGNAKDECSDLTDNNNDDDDDDQEEQIPRSFPQKVSAMRMNESPCRLLAPSSSHYDGLVAVVRHDCFSR